jgi:predicted transcriptional regulator
VKTLLTNLLQQIHQVKELNEKRQKVVLELNYSHDQVNNITEKMRTKSPDKVTELKDMLHNRILVYEEVLFHLTNSNTVIDQHNM